MRSTSTCCGCNFSFSITCPALKVPNTPSVTQPENGCVLNDFTFSQCGNPVWAYGDTLAAVNGIVTGADDSEDAACTHACCIVCCCPRVQFDLSTCPEVYGTPGVYYHRIRYVTNSFEVSDFSEENCFCIARAEYCLIPREYHYKCFCCYDICRTDCVNEQCCSYTRDLNSCLVFEIADDPEFNNVLSTTTCDDSCINNNCQELRIPFSVFPDPTTGEYPDVGTTYYSRAKIYGATDCQPVNCTEVQEATVKGCLYLFALCDGVNDIDSNSEGSCCIQLYATYTPCYGYGEVSSQNTQYKFDVSPFCDFSTPITTCTGCYNTFIPKSDLAAGGACPEYFVRACVVNCDSEGNEIVPDFVRCARLGNVTKLEISGVPNGDSDSCLQSCGMICDGTINWNGTLAVMGISSGAGVGKCIELSCDGFENETFSCDCLSSSGYRNLWCGIGGRGGRVVVDDISGKNGCSFRLYAGYPNCGSYRCEDCGNNNASFFCINNDDTCIVADEGNLSGGGFDRYGLDDFSMRYGECDLSFVGYHGASGMILNQDDPTNDNSNNRNAGIIYLDPNLGYSNETDLYNSGISQYICSCLGGRRVSSFGNPTCSCFMKCLCNNCFGTEKCCIDNGPSLGCSGLNLYGAGGFAGAWCINNCCLYCVEGRVESKCFPTPGFGFGGGAPANLFCKGTDLLCQCSPDLCDSFFGCKSIPGSGCSYMHLWPKDADPGLYFDCGHFAAYFAALSSGGGGGMMFLCNCFRLTHCNWCNQWQGRPGYMLFACQDFE